jgi:predicted membrane chloride channel (bestrophin family)
VPLEITLFLSTYLAWLQRNGLLSPAIATALTVNIASLQDTMANLDRIRTTPIPFAYQAHLRMTMW